MVGERREKEKETASKKEPKHVPACKLLEPKHKTATVGRSEWKGDEKRKESRLEGAFRWKSKGNDLKKNKLPAERQGPGEKKQKQEKRKKGN